MPKGIYLHKKHSEETKRKISEANKGQIPWNKGKIGVHSGNKNPMFGKKHNEKTRQKMSEARKGEKNHMWGKHLSEEHKRKISKALKGQIPWNKGKEYLQIKGEKNYNWRGGISFEPYSIDWTETLKRAIRERDRYTCQLCGQYGLDVHHIDYDKKNCSLDNLITLCRSCHAKTNHNRDYWKNYFKEII